MAKKRKPQTQSSIDPATLAAMQEQNRLAAEAQKQEALLLQQQTENQAKQYQAMMAVAEQQTKQAEEARLLEQQVAEELKRKQEEQAMLAQGEVNRQEATLQESRGRQLRQYNRRNSLLTQRSAAMGGRVSLFTGATTAGQRNNLLS